MIITERLTLRLPRLTDLEDVHAIFSDDEAMTYWSSAAHRTLAQTAEWLQPLFDEPEASPFDYFIEFEGRIIGKLGCWRLPDIGYVLNRAYWGRGFAREALAAFVAHMRALRATDYLLADVDPRNTRSRQLLLSFGFRHVGYRQNSMKTHIGWCDSDYYRLDLEPAMLSAAL